MAMTPETFSLFKFEAVNRPVAEARRIFDQRIADALHIYHQHNQGFVVRPCPACGHHEWNELEKFHGTYGVVKCRRCASVYVNPAPHLEALIDYYNNCACNAMLQDLYKKRSVSKSSPILDERVQSIVSLIRARIEHQVGPVSVLEIGCGSGRFLANLKGVLEQQGLSERVRLVGVDIDRNAVALNSDDSLELHGLPIEEFAEQTLEQFDVVLHFELIEHLGDPAGFVQRCRGLLKQGGAMVFTTPNDLGFENVASGYNGFRLIAHSIFPPMHLNAFSTQNIAVFLLRCGFAVKSIATPGNLDADMVSLMKSDLDDPVYRAFVELSDQEKALFQQLVKKLSCSSHMLVVAGI